MKSKNVPFSDLFDEDVIGDGPIAAGYTVAGVPQRFAHIMYGSKREDIGYAENGVDLSNKWAGKGTAVYVVAPSITNIEVLATGINSASGSATITVRRNGEFDATRSSSSGGTQSYDSTWYRVPSATIGDGYEVIISVAFSGPPATVSNGAPNYVPLNQDRACTVQLVVNAQVVVMTTATINVKIRKISTGVVMLDHNVTIPMEVGNDA